MNKTIKMRPQGAKPTAEELAAQQEAQAKRAFVQKRNSVAEMMIASALSGGYSEDLCDLIDGAVKAADHYMERAFFVKAEPKAEE